MQLKALVATLVLGSSSVALAAPQVRDHRYEPAPIAARFDAHLIARNIRPMTRPLPVAQTPVTIANDLSLNRRTVIDVTAQRRFTKLELRADGRGKVDIDRVIVHFGNGESQTVNLDARLSRRQPAVSIDLTGNARFIDRIVIVGSSKNRSSALDVVAL